MVSLGFNKIVSCCRNSDSLKTPLKALGTRISNFSDVSRGCWRRFKGHLRQKISTSGSLEFVLACFRSSLTTSYDNNSRFRCFQGCVLAPLPEPVTIRIIAFEVLQEKVLAPLPGASSDKNFQVSLRVECVVSFCGSCT